MLFRPAVEADLDRVLPLVVADPLSWVDEKRFGEELAAAQYRVDRVWVAEQDDRILACAVWWTMPGKDHPGALDVLSVADTVADPCAVASDLLSTAHQVFATAGTPNLPEYHIRLFNGWRDDPSVTAVLDWRRRAAAGAGLTEGLERLQYRWTPEDPVPGPPERLVFTEQPDDEVFLDVFRQVSLGSLDTHTRRGVEAHGVDRTARDDLDFYRGMPGERSWWRLAHDRAGRLVGFAIPSANPYSRNVGYLGVLPAFRGHGHIDEILGEITRFHAAARAEKITATTDVVNRPMAAAFERGGYHNYEVRMLLSAPQRSGPGD